VTDGTGYCTAGAAVNPTKKSQSGEAKEASMHVTPYTRDACTDITSVGGEECSSDTWLQISFRVQGKGCCELGAAIVEPDSMAREHREGRLACCELSKAAAQPPGASACMVGTPGPNHQEGALAHREGHSKQLTVIPTNERVLGFVTTVFRSDTHGMTGGRACIRCSAREPDAQGFGSLYLVNPYAPETVRQVLVTEWRRML
jgi:hypothetical protein